MTVSEKIHFQITTQLDHPFRKSVFPYFQEKARSVEATSL
jgi:hypothetical protein